MNAFITAYAQSDFFGKLIFIGLISTSVICWIVLLHKIWMIRRVKNTAQAFLKAFQQNQKPILGLALEDLPKPRSQEVPHPFGNIFLALKDKTLEALNKNHHFAKQGFLSPEDIELVESHALMVLSSQAKKLEKNLFVLSTIVTLAPFLGLLGTVWGILITFAQLQAGASASSNSIILGGLSTALATTVLGLVIAIPALIAHNYLKNESRSLSSEMEDFLYSLLTTVELQYRKVAL